MNISIKKRLLIFSGILGLAFILLLLPACDIIDPKDAREITPTDTTGDTLKTATTDTTIIGGQSIVLPLAPLTKVLVEDYTGHQCGNCPGASTKAAVVDSLYGNKISVMEVHVGFFARTSSTFNINYRTAAGDKLNTDFGLNDQLPKGMINRKPFTSSTVLLNPDDWIGATDAITKTVSATAIGIKATYDTASRSLNVKAYTKYRSDVNDSYGLTAYLTEDSLVSPQVDYRFNPDFIARFLHRHVLRKGLDPTEGNVLNAAPAVKGTSFLRSMSTILSPAWKPKNCRVNVIVYNTTSKEIIQAEWIELESLLK
ncbi:MAG: Omp28-related outer membrane protein [Bacteroidota bacterium]